MRSRQTLNFTALVLLLLLVLYGGFRWAGDAWDGRAVGEEDGARISSADHARKTSGSPSLEASVVAAAKSKWSKNKVNVFLDLQSPEAPIISTADVALLDAPEFVAVNRIVREMLLEFSRLELEHHEVVESNLRTDVILIDRLGEAGLRLKERLLQEIEAALPGGENDPMKQGIVELISSQTGNFGQSLRAIYTEPMQGSFKFTIGCFDDPMIENLAAFKKGEHFKNMGEFSRSYSFRASAPPYWWNVFYDLSGKIHTP